MFKRHVHQWVDESAVYNNPAIKGEASGLTQETVRQMIFGITNFTQRCTTCNEINVVTCVGKAITQPLRLVK